MADDPIRIGILGAAKIAPAAIIEPARDNRDVVVQAIAARSPDRARAFSSEHGIAHVAEDYEALIARDDIDLVYIALPPSAHLLWATAALEAGKHVLCEKPFAMNASEAAQMVSRAEKAGLHLIEAFHYRFHPLHGQLKQLMRELGTIEHISAKFCVPIPNAPGELRYIPELGGGALMDLGCYPLHLCRTLLGEEPLIEAAQARWHETGVDEALAAKLTFPAGVSANIYCSMQVPQKEKILAEIRGKNGTLQVNNFIVPHISHAVRLETRMRRWRGTVSGQSTYAHQLEHVVRFLRSQEQAITSGEDAIATMSAIDAIYAKARRGD